MDIQSDYCVGCLRDSEVILQCHSIHTEIIKTIFQKDSIILCYLCKKIAQHTEQFIQNVVSNQIFLENIAQLSKSAIKEAQEQTPAVISLSLATEETLEFGKEENVASNISVTVRGYNGVVSEKKEITIDIKEEMKEELQDNQFDDDFDNDYQEPIVKTEDSEEFLVKQEVDLDELDLKHLSRVLKKKVTKKHKDKKKSIKVEKNGNPILEKIYVTKKQCLQERKKNASNEEYLKSPYKCEDCIKGFRFENSYENHRLKHSKSMGDYECNICKQRTDTEEKLKSHKKYHEVRYKCVECGIIRTTPLSVKDHYRLEHTDQLLTFNCTICSKSFKRKKSLHNHKIQVHTDRERVTCGYCQKSYATKQVLKAHMMNRHPSEVSTLELIKRYSCEECGKTFNAPSQLKYHRVKHSINKDYYCVECDRSFKSDSILKHHLKTALPHVKYVDLPLSCSSCDKKFAIKRDLERHTNRVHLKIKPYQCDKCDRAYINGWSLTEHKRLAHEGYKRPLKFPCTMCDKVFDRNQILKSHIRTHTGERPYQCAECGAQFSQGSILRTHIKLIHLNLTRDGRPKLSVR